MSFWSGPPQTPPPPPLETRFLEVLREVGGGGNPALFLGQKIMNLLVSLLDFQLKKFFRVPTSWRLYGAEWDER